VTANRSNPWAGKTLGLIGAGNMGEALIRGAVGGGVIEPAAILACDPLAGRRAVFADLGCGVASDFREAAKRDVILLAVKPQTFRTVAEELAACMPPAALVLSIAAGVTAASLESALPGRARVVRIMPNTPLTVGMGMSAVARGAYAGDEDAALALALFSAAGKAVEVEEALLDAVTALSGSGPAYLFHFAEALIAGGEGIGLPSGLSNMLAVQTLRGAAEMLARGGDPADLRRRVASPGGTTAAALAVFEDRGFVAIVEEALRAACKRGEELGGGT
jgi:pyrroline-5-carboxylate reductase